VAKQSALKQHNQRKSRAAETSLRAVGRGGARAAAAATTVKEPDPTELEKLIHERLRLGIISALAVNEQMTFNELKTALKTTDGNLSVHARKLEEAKYIACEKYFDGRTPKTEYRLTDMGRRALERYLNHMEAIIRRTRES
jgi:DNA-binding HxlR family transcriptional regulator